jgi:DNA-binding MarR family transcriptional regulator
MGPSRGVRRPFKAPAVLPFDPPDYLLHLLAAISRYRDVELDRQLEPLGLSVARYRALNAIMGFAPCLMGELADFIGVDRTTITRTVDQLVAAGLVRRHTPPSDRRQVALNPTEAGRNATEAARRIVFALNRRVLEGVPDGVLMTIIRAEQRMFANLAVDPVAVERMLAFRRPEPAE